MSVHQPMVNWYKAWPAAVASLWLAWASPSVAQTEQTPMQAANDARKGATTAWHTMAANGDLQAMAKNPELQANLEARDESGRTPLQTAVANGQLPAAAWLVGQGARVAVRDPQGNTLLHQVLLQGNTLGYVLPPAEWIANRPSHPNQKLYAEFLAPAPNEEPPNPILQAVSFVLACGVEAGARNNAGLTALEMVLGAARPPQLMLSTESETNLLRLLQAGGGSLDVLDAQGQTPLHLACLALDSQKMQRLIANGADVNATNRLGQTPLHLVAGSFRRWDPAASGSNQPFQLLLQAHVRVNLQDREGRTPLHLLLAEHSSWPRAERWVKTLVQNGADFSLKDNQGKTPLHYFATNQSPFFAMRGVGDTFNGAKLDPNARDNDGNTPLHIAARTGSGLVDWLVQQGGKLEATNNAGETPRRLLARQAKGYPRPGQTSADTDIFMAARTGKIESLEALLKADPELLTLTNQMGETVLRVAAVARQTNTWQFLEKQGARWDAISAVLAGQTQALAAVLAEQPGEIKRQLRGRPLTHVAIVRGNLPTLSWLHQAGADLQAPDERGLSPLGIAQLEHQTEAVDFLRQKGAKANLFDAAYNGLAENTRALLDANPSLVNSTNTLGRTPLATAAGCGRLEVLELLLAKGAARDAAGTKDGLTALHLAAAYNQTATARLLLNQGAKVDAADGHGLTPLHQAAAHGSTEVAQLLLQHKASLNLPSARPAAALTPEAQFLSRRFPHSLGAGSPLHFAVLFLQTNTVQLLLKSGAEVNPPDSIDRTPLDLLLGSMGTMGSYSPATMNLISGDDPVFLHDTATLPSFSQQMEQRKTIQRLLEAAGGKRGQSGQRFGP